MGTDTEYRFLGTEMTETGMAHGLSPFVVPPSGGPRSPWRRVTRTA